MSAENLLSRLERVKRTGAGRWIAKCPAHPDKGPSLSVRELDDGRVLVHCFAGCDVHSVLSAAGLSFDDLFPTRDLGHRTKREGRPFSAYDALRCVAFELTLAVIVARDLADGKSLSAESHSRFLVGVERIRAAEALCNE